MLNGYAFPNGSPAIPTDSQPPSQGFRSSEHVGKRAQEGLNINGKRAEAPLADPGGPEHQNALMELARENLLLKHQLHAATLEVTRLQSVVETYNHIKEEKQEANNMKQSQSRYWSEEEHQRFLVAIQTYGHKDVKAIASVVRTRNATQVRTHAQKYFMKLARSRTQEGGGKGSNPDQEPSETTEDEQSKSMEAAAAAAAAAGEAGTSAAAAAAFVAATNKQQSASKQRTTTPKVEVCRVLPSSLFLSRRFPVLLFALICVLMASHMVLFPGCFRDVACSFLPGGLLASRMSPAASSFLTLPLFLDCC